MANTSVQAEVGDWVRKHWMPEIFGMPFDRESVQLTSGGVFEFGAVSSDRSIVASISTSGASTASGKRAVGKLQKIRSDMLFLLLAISEKRFIVLTELDMYELCQSELERGRVPPEIEFHRVTIPAELNTRLIASRRRASKEVSPRG